MLCSRNVPEGPGATERKELLGIEPGHALKPFTQLLSAMALLFAIFAGPALGGEIEILSAALEASDEGYTLDADVNIELSARLEEVVSRGVPLYFVTEFELKRPRWYWFDAKVVVESLIFRLSYHAITRQYRLSTGALHQSFATLDEALRTLSRIRGWSVADHAALGVGHDYLAALRMRLDLTQLPKPLQVTAIGSREWSLTSGWLRWTYTASTRNETE